MREPFHDNKKLYAKKILVAEDVELNQHLARHILESRGAAVAIANNGHEALQLVQDHFFDCVLMDVQMPEMDGIEATQCIRQLEDPIKSAVPIIALTANVHYDDIEKYKAAGMNDYLAKPFDESGLVLVILKNQVPEKNTEPSSIMPDKLLYDLSMIHSMSGGDAGFTKKMVLLFIETVPQNVNELALATKSGNWEQTAKMAHKLKSTVDSMGIKVLRDDIRLVESNAKENKSLDEIPALVQKIESVIHDCIEQLRTEVE